MRLKLITILLFIISIQTKGQFFDKIIVSTGMTHSDLIFDYSDNNETLTDYEKIYAGFGRKSLIGFYNQVNFEYYETKNISLVTGLGFYQKGAYDEIPGNTYNIENHWDLNYLTFDTKFKFRYQLKNMIPFVFLGPRIDYLLNHGSNYNSYNSQTKLNKINYGIRYGVGLHFEKKNIITGFSFQNNSNFNSILINDGEFIRPKFKINDKTMIVNFDFGLKLK